VVEESGLIRFVISPDGQIVPDLSRRLPGRGLWVAADRGAIDAAVKKDLFAKAARGRLDVRPDLADQVADLMARRLLSALGLARKAGELTFGFTKVLAAIEASRAAVLIEATDGSADGRLKLLAAARRAARPPLRVGLFTSAELGLALGGDNVIHTAFLAGRGADRWTSDVQRLSGFRPLFPESWREE
jgi:predicted RNA-binding protein YlxR (DUF448 family)